MPSYEHAQMLAAIHKLGERPRDSEALASWLRAERHLQLLKANATDSEIIIYANSETIFIHTVLASEAELFSPVNDDLLEWSSSPYEDRAGYWWSWDSEGAQVGLASEHEFPAKLGHRQNLIFGREIEGMRDSQYFELLQEFAHAVEIHWREERRAYCRLDENGDLEPVVSITSRNGRDKATLVTCLREPLEQFLAATKTTLVQFFDFTMVNHGRFKSWGAISRERKSETPNIHYYQFIHPDGHAFSKGVQFIRTLTPGEELLASIRDPRSRRRNQKYETFIAYDWRNDRIGEISTDPEYTTNYFAAEVNSLPFETSPAFFRPEVLTKYKADRD